MVGAADANWKPLKHPIGELRSPLIITVHRTSVGYKQARWQERPQLAEVRRQRGGRVLHVAARSHD